MSFMEPQVTPLQNWLEIDTANGIWFVPASFLPNIVKAFDDESVEDVLEVDGIAESLLQYTECGDPSDINNISIRSGYGARLSAPGYIDATEWSVFDTEAEAESYLEETYGEDDEVSA